ncbi:MAG: cyclic nucleotide-binding domain-containing protein, partial [Peristeroidobacter soli]
MQNELYEKRREQMFPKLSGAQLSRLEAQGRRVRTQAGDVLVEPGQRHHDMVVVLAGSLEVGLPGMRGEEIVTVLQPGDFAGEMSTLRGVPGFTRIRVREAGEILSISEENLRNIVQTDAEVSEMFMRAFILRRMGLVASGQSEAMLLGSRHSGDTLRLREFLTRNNYPYVSVDIDTDADVQALLERFHVAVDEV